MVENTTDGIVIIGLILNAVVTVLAVAKSKLNLEHRITKVETLVNVLLHRFHVPIRGSDAPEDETQ